MLESTIELSFREKVCREIRLAKEGIGRYRVSTPFMFDDGDHLVIVLREEEGSKWVIADEGHTYMHLSYDLDERQLQSGTRAKIISNVLSSHSVMDQDGELLIRVEDDDYGSALYTFIQALLRITDVSYLTHERVRSTFMDDFSMLLRECLTEERLQFNWYDPGKDPKANYTVDCRVNQMARPLLVFALLGDDRVRDATIALHQFERWGMSFDSLAIFEDQESVARKVLARFSDVCGKQFSSIGTNRDRIQRFLHEAASVS